MNSKNGSILIEIQLQLIKVVNKKEVFISQQFKMKVAEIRSANPTSAKLQVIERFWRGKAYRTDSDRVTLYTGNRHLEEQKRTLQPLFLFFSKLHQLIHFV